MLATAEKTGVGGDSGQLAPYTPVSEIDPTYYNDQRRMIKLMLAGQTAIPEEEYAEACRDCFGTIRKWMRSNDSIISQRGVRQFDRFVQTQTRVAALLVAAAAAEAAADTDRRRVDTNGRTQLTEQFTLTALLTLSNQVTELQAQQRETAATPHEWTARELEGVNEIRDHAGMPPTTSQALGGGTITGMTDPPSEPKPAPPPAIVFPNVTTSPEPDMAPPLSELDREEADATAKALWGPSPVHGAREPIGAGELPEAKGVEGTRGPGEGGVGPPSHLSQEPK